MKKILLISVFIFSLLLCACSSTSIEGVYAGSTGRTTLNIKKDGELTYTQISKKDGSQGLYEGTWEQNDDEVSLTIKGINRDKKMDASLDENGVIFIPDQGTWNAENFYKNEK